MGMPATAPKEWTYEMLESLPDDGNPRAHTGEYVRQRGQGFGELDRHVRPTKPLGRDSRSVDVLRRPERSHDLVTAIAGESGHRLSHLAVADDGDTPGGAHDAFPKNS